MRQLSCIWVVAYTSIRHLSIWNFIELFTVLLQQLWIQYKDRDLQYLFAEMDPPPTIIITENPPPTIIITDDSPPPYEEFQVKEVDIRIKLSLQWMISRDQQLVHNPRQGLHL